LKVSIIIPAFNEDASIEILLNKIFRIDLIDYEKEIIAINDGSTDSTLLQLEKFKDKITILTYDKNIGKGAAIRAGFQSSTGDIILIQDADLEYHPEDYLELLVPFNTSAVDVVLGVRKLINKPSDYILSPYFYGGRIINYFFNSLSPIRITDIHTGYKLARRALWTQLNLQEDGFNFCHEFLIKSILLKAQIVEVPVSYSPRSRKQGKKIKAKDGIIAIKTIIKLFFENKIRKRLP
jgi:glycosyltransferase involved in cell wall biosynthesis